MLADILNPLWWFSFFGQTFRWWFVCQLLGIIAFPICFLVFRTFRDRGYALCRVFGILFLTWINWYLCTVLRFSFLSVLLALLIFAAASLFCIVRRRAELTAWVRKSWKTMLIIDLVFLFTFLFFVNVRSYRPEAMFDPGHSGAEKMMNCAYLHALMRSPHFPPGNTWLWGEDTRPARDTAAVEDSRKGEAEAGTAVEASGKKPSARRTRKFLINYYYFGHLQWATLAKLSGYPAHVAFNLGLATVFALTFTAALCLGLNMTRRWPWAFLCAFMIAFFGNLDPLQQMIQRIGFWIIHKAANITAWQSVWAQRRIVFTTVDFWRTSRIMDNTVTEFPYFSAILGDLHPHHMSLPLVLLAIGAGLALVQAVRRPWNGMKEFFRGHGLRLLMFAFVIGGTFAANTWDAIVMGFFAFCLMFYLVLKHQGAGWKSFIQAGFLVLGTGLSAVLLFTLFKLNFESPVKNEIIVKSWFPLEFEKFKMLIGSVPWKIRTDLTDYLVFFGLMLVPVALYVRRRAASLFSGMTPGARIAWLAVSLMVLIYSRGVWRFWLPGAALLWLSICIAFLLSRSHGRRGDYFSLLCIVVAFFTLFIEIFFFDDRMVGD